MRQARGIRRAPELATVVERTGDWTMKKWMGNSHYTFTVSQTDGDTTTTLAPSPPRTNPHRDCCRFG